MSAEEYKDSLSVTIPVTVYSFCCDAVDCWNMCCLMVDDEDQLVRIDDMMADYPLPISDEDDARTALLEKTGWQEGVSGVQRGHLYCPKHRTETKQGNEK